MKIAIDARELSVDRPGGLRSYAEAVVGCLMEHGTGHSLRLYLDRELAGEISSAADWRVCPPRQLAVREQFTLPRRLAADGMEIGHFLANTAPLRCSIPFVLTLHDTFCLDRSLLDIAQKGSAHNKALSLYSKLIPLLAARRARRVVTVSQHSAERIARRVRIPIERIAVIPQGMDSCYRPVEASEKRDELLRALGTSRIVLVLGSPEPRKNVANALHAVALAQQKDRELGLILVWPATVDFGTWAARTVPQLPTRMHVQSSVSNEELVFLYSSADVFLFASADEGFGLPVVEAMACGCPVVTSNASCLPDTANGAALLVDPGDACDIADGVLALASDSGLRGMYRELGLSRANEFSRERAAASLLRLYEESLRLSDG